MQGTKQEKHQNKDENLNTSKQIHRIYNEYQAGTDRDIHPSVQDLGIKLLSD